MIQLYFTLKGGEVLVKILKTIFGSPAVLAVGVVAVFAAVAIVASAANRQDLTSNSPSGNEPVEASSEDGQAKQDPGVPSQEVSYDDAYNELNTLISPTSSGSVFASRRVAATKASATPSAPTVNPVVTITPDPEPEPDPVYYTVTRTGAYKYTPAEVEAGVAATNPAYFTRTGNVFNTTLKAGTYGGGYSQPGNYFYLNELYYQINFSSSLTFLNIGTHLTYKNQTLDFYVDDTLAIQLILVEETNNPGTEFYVTKQYNLDPDYLWHTGAYGQVQGGPYVFDPVDISLQYVCSGC